MQKFGRVFRYARGLKWRVVEQLVCMALDLGLFHRSIRFHKKSGIIKTEHRGEQKQQNSAHCGSEQQRGPEDQQLIIKNLGEYQSKRHDAGHRKRYEAQLMHPPSSIERLVHPGRRPLSGKFGRDRVEPQPAHSAKVLSFLVLSCTVWTEHGCNIIRQYQQISSIKR